jgi:hypothetical protein
MERKLASIQRIREIRPIEGADAIELAIINSWQVVVAKNVGHKVDDFVVYCEIDSFLPIREEFEFLRKSSHKKMGDQEGFRRLEPGLRTQSMPRSQNRSGNGTGLRPSRVHLGTPGTLGWETPLPPDAGIGVAPGLRGSAPPRAGSPP